jgi:hypothetical protein
MVDIIIGILWVAVIAIICAGIVWIAMYLIGRVWAIPERVQQAVWAVFGLLVLIYILSVFAGGGHFPHPFQLR